MNKKQLFLILIVAIVAVLLLIFQIKNSDNRSQRISNIDASKKGVALYLDPENKTVKIGDIFGVNIILDTVGMPIDGVDIYSFHYNPVILEVVDDVANKKGVQVLAGQILPVSAANIVDQTVGIIKLGLLSLGGSTYNGRGILATIRFKALKAGETNLYFDFNKGDTRDTNAAYNGKDQLTEAIGATYVVK